MGAVAAGAILFALLLVVAAAAVWQEARSTRRPEEALYLMGEAAAFVHRALPDELRGRLEEGEVRSLLEWSTYHSQVVVVRSGAGIPVVGGPEAVSFVEARAAERGLPLGPGDVATVLDLEAAYLVSIGAVGEMVEERLS